jgi:cytochrome bd-type quinol oxidase subunit 2
MPELFRVVVLIALAAIVVSLGSALYHLSRGTQKDSAKMARALTVRIVLSIALFVLIMLAWYAGLITPHSVVPNRH